MVFAFAWRAHSVLILYRLTLRSIISLTLVKLIGVAMGEIQRYKYPELDKILWDFHAEHISPDFAFDMYKQRWNFVNKRKITKPEQKLITKLVSAIGHGFFAI